MGVSPSIGHRSFNDFPENEFYEASLAAIAVLHSRLSEIKDIFVNRILS